MVEDLTKEELVGRILLPARTDSEWDSCDAYLIQPDPEMLRNLIDKMDVAAYLEAKATAEGAHYSGFSHIAFHGSCGEFIVVSDPYDWQTGKSDDIVQIDEELAELLDICTPEQRTDTPIIKAYPNSVVFVAYGKHTSEEFWTSELTRDEINKLLAKSDNES